MRMHPERQTASAKVAAAGMIRFVVISGKYTPGKVP
jgi:hypothetical protein